MAPCVASPHPETDRLEAKQLRMCLLSKRGLRYRDKSPKATEGSFLFSPSPRGGVGISGATQNSPCFGCSRLVDLSLLNLAQSSKWG